MCRPFLPQQVCEERAIPISYLLPGSHRHCCQQRKNLHQIRCNEGLPSMPIGRRKPAPHCHHHTVQEVQAPPGFLRHIIYNYWNTKTEEWMKLSPALQATAALWMMLSFVIVKSISIQTLLGSSCKDVQRST